MTSLAAPEDSAINTVKDQDLLVANDANNLDRFNLSDDELMSVASSESDSDNDEESVIDGCGGQPKELHGNNPLTETDNETRGRPSACVFVASLSSSLTDDVLCQSVTAHFKQWGQVSLVKVLRDPANRPYAFVQYDTDEDANRAIMEGQHSILNGRTVRCEKARVNRTLYLQLPPPGMAQTKMKQLLDSFGEVERMVPVNDNFNIIQPGDDTHTNWFSKFVYRQDAISAFANLKTRATWNIEWAQNLEDEYSNVPEVTIDRFSIFVGHLDPRITKDELVERFEKHGKIKEAILVNRPLSNFAFIKFRTKDSAASAVERENHSMFKFKTIHVQYREMYNNYKRKYSNENGFKLNLAPPPVNFKRRSNSYDRGGLKAVNFDVYDQQPRFQKRFNSFNGKKFKDRRPFMESSNHNGHEHVHIRDHISEPKAGIHAISINVDADIEMPEADTATVASSKDADETTTGSSAVPKTGYTYTTMDGIDVDAEEYYAPGTPGFQSPYYYYYVPGKDVKGGNKVEMMMPPPPPPMPPASNGAYYYPYPNYSHAPLSANQPVVHPYYFYYNPMGVDGLPMGPCGPHGPGGVPPATISRDFAYPSFKPAAASTAVATVPSAGKE